VFFGNSSNSHWWLKRSQAVQARSKLISLEPKKYLIHKKKIKESQEKAYVGRRRNRSIWVSICYVSLKNPEFRFPK
jgi:hypothetical protein